MIRTSSQVSQVTRPLSLDQFLNHLLAHAERESASHEAGRYEVQDALALELGISRVRADELYSSLPSFPAQVALLGPTQAGKSSLANALLGAGVAEVSPLAGFTVHAQGFCWGHDVGRMFEALDPFFWPLRRVERAGLAADNLDCFVATDVAAAPILPLSNSGCLWDTPDFDSVGADAYRGQVLRTTALADVVPLVLSKDKYSDQSVWSLVSLLEPLRLPSLIVLNKVDPQARDPLLNSLAEKWQATRRDPLPPVVTLAFGAGGSMPLDAPEVGELRRLIATQLQTARRPQRRTETRTLLSAHWGRWLDPVHAEINAQGEWDQAIARELDEILGRYERDYLNHPHHYETFQRALARLLTLLELPGLAGAVASMRRVLTWPFRQASALRRRASTGANTDEAGSGEQAVLRELLEHVLLQLQQYAWDRKEEQFATSVWWNDLLGLLRSGHGEFKDRIRSALAGYSVTFQEEIDETARSLYRRLEDRPMVLNSLRATRITTDAAALAIALHSGGIGIQDFVIAPATLSLTSMLTESALGHYVNRAAEDLKARQLRAVEVLLRDTIGEWLASLPRRLDGSRHLKLTSADIATAEEQLAHYV